MGADWPTPFAPGQRTVRIIDAGMGNLTSVTNAFRAIGACTEVLDDPAQLGTPTHVVLPGVGAFGEGMTRLRAGGWTGPLRSLVDDGVQLLGICLGMQLLMARGTEHGDQQGLSLVAGSTERLRPDDRALRVPHIGWNDVEFVRPCPLFEDLKDPTAFYFVHSFAVVPEDDGVVTGLCKHGGEVVASIQSENVYGVQFHPEKSHRAGLSVLTAFLRAGVAGGC